MRGGGEVFGWLYGLFCFSAKGIGKAQRAIWDEQNRERAKQNGQDTYYGKNGEHLVSNGRSVWRKRDRNGDDVLADLYTGEVYKNYSQEKREAKVKEALENGETVLDADPKEYRKSSNHKYHKALISLGYYKDIKTGKLFTKVMINRIYFYMDPDGRLVRMADRTTTDANRYNITPEEIISIVNKRREELLPLIKDKGCMWLSNVFYLSNNRMYYYIKDDKKLYMKYSGSKIERDSYGEVITQ